MEEDIEILKKKIEKCKECKFATCEQCEINWTEIQAIEHLIARNKVLGVENKNLKLINETLNNSYDSLEKAQSLLKIQFEKINTEIQDLCIPKSKVREILEKLKGHNYKCNFDDVDFLQNIIIEIQELLED